jgi:toxin FitB
MTRMPAGQRVEAYLAHQVIAATFPDPWLTLDAGAARNALAELGRRAITGGSVYDALIAICARAHGAALVSLDRRALPTYVAVGVEHRLI